MSFPKDQSLSIVASIREYDKELTERVVNRYLNCLHYTYPYRTRESDLMTESQETIQKIVVILKRAADLGYNLVLYSSLWEPIIMMQVGATNDFSVLTYSNLRIDDRGCRHEVRLEEVERIKVS